MSIEITYNIPKEKIDQALRIYMNSNYGMSLEAIIEYALEIGLVQLAKDSPAGIVKPKVSI